MVVCSCNLYRSLDRRGEGGSKRKAAVSPGCAQTAGCLMEAFNSAGDSHVQSVGPEHVANVSSTRRSSRGVLRQQHGQIFLSRSTMKWASIVSTSSPRAEKDRNKALTEMLLSLQALGGQPE